MREVDYLIVGQGLAGSVLACMLRMARKKVLVIDNAHRTAASLAAAGIINPITGKRLNRPFLVDQLLADAFSIYASIEQFLGTTFFRRRKVLRLLQSAEEQKQWTERLSTTDYAKYLGSIECPYFVSDCPWFGGFEIENPFFKKIQLNPAKGEMLTLRAPDFTDDRIIQRGKWFFRTSTGEVKTGTTYRWDRLDESPTQAAREEIERSIREFAGFNFEVSAQSAGVRPVIRVDNRPVIGTHPQYKRIAIFNGLGSKGALQAPFASGQLIDNLEKSLTIHPEFDVCRKSLW